MNKQFTASEVQKLLAEYEDLWIPRELCGEPPDKAVVVMQLLRAYADLLEEREKAVPVAWSLIFEESIGVNAPTTYNRREDAEDYADACAMPDKCNPFPHRPKVVPLYTHPTPADADRLAEQRDDAFQQAVQEARRVWMDEFPCEAGHDHVTPFDQFLYGNKPCVEAQPPAASVPGAHWFKASAWLTDESFGYDRWKADMYSMGKGTHDAYLLIIGDVPSLGNHLKECENPLATRENPNG